MNLCKTIPITVAIVGLGRAGWRLHLLPMLEHPAFEIVAVVDPIEERRKEAYDLVKCEAYASIDELLVQTQAELVVVATPSSAHYSDVLKVLHSGRHCIAEKPLAMSACEGAKLLSAAKEKNIHLFVYHPKVFGAEIQHLREVIQSGVLGPLFHLRSIWGNYARRWDWQTLRKNGGGQLNNICTHALSIVLPLLNSRITHVHSTLRNVKDSGDAEDHVHLVLHTESGITADLLVSSAIALTPPKWMLCGKYGTLMGSETKSQLRYFDPSKFPSPPPLDSAAPNRAYLSEEIAWEVTDVEIPPAKGSSFHQNVFDVLRKNAPMVVTPESALEILRVIDLARAATRPDFLL